MIGKLHSLSFNRDGTQNITVTVPFDYREEFDKLKDKEVVIDIKKYSKRRSLDANAYAWFLIDKIAAETGKKKSEIYRELIKDIPGASLNILVKTKDADGIIAAWVAHGLGWQVENVEESKKVDGCTRMVVYEGSSVFDVDQMRQFINFLQQDAYSLGIPIMTEEEKEKLMDKWEKKKEKEKEEDK